MRRRGHSNADADAPRPGPSGDGGSSSKSPSSENDRESKKVPQGGVGGASIAAADGTARSATAVPPRHSRRIPNGMSVVVVGGGPAGSLAAKAFADRGCNVRLFEKRPRPSTSAGSSAAQGVVPSSSYRSSNNPNRKAYVVSLTDRGLRSMSRLGVQPGRIEGCVSTRTVCRHGPTARLIRRRTPAIVVPRQRLATFLLDEAEAAGVDVRCECALIGLDLEKRVATFRCGDGGRRRRAGPASVAAVGNPAGEKDEDGDSKSNSNRSEGGGPAAIFDVQYDLLIGADGSKSTVRRILEERVDAFTVRTEEDRMECQVAVTPHWSTLMSVPLHESFERVPPDAVHVWSSSKSNNEYSGRDGTAMSFPLDDGQNLWTIMFPRGRWADLRTGGKVAYMDAMSTLFPDLTVDARMDIANQLSGGSSSEPAVGGTCVWVSSLGSARHGIALVGDAGHGMWPSLGQGCDAALETAACLADAVDACCHCASAVAPSDDDDDGARAFSFKVVDTFDRARREDATAAVDLSRAGFGGKRNRGRSLETLWFEMQVALMMILNRLTLGVVPQPALLRLFLGEDIPYATLKRHSTSEKCALVGALLFPLLWFLSLRLFSTFAT